MKIEELTDLEGQMTIDQYLDDLEDDEPLEYGYRGCRGCVWFLSESRRCRWAQYKDRPNKPQGDFIYPTCDGACHFQPSAYKIPKMCSNCKWANEFVYKNKPEYAKELTEHNGYTRKAADDPLEEPNIYCTHPQGSLNRRTEYNDREWAGFGVGHWDRQHEWDTCDRWEIERDGYRNFDFEEKGKKAK